MLGAGAEPWMMPVGKRARLGVRGEISAQPGILCRARVLGKVAVEGDYVPVAEVVAVVSRRRIACCRTEVAVVARRAERVVVMVSRRWLGSVLVSSPRGTVAIGEFLCGTIGVVVVAEGEYGARNRIE